MLAGIRHETVPAYATHHAARRYHAPHSCGNPLGEGVERSAEALNAIPQHAVDPNLDQPGSALAGVARHVIKPLQQVVGDRHGDLGRRDRLPGWLRGRLGVWGA